MSNQPDIFLYIQQKWPNSAYQIIDQINEWDAKLKTLLDDRRLRAALFLSKADDECGLEEIIRIATVDSDNLIQRAEYDSSGKRKYDFNKTFHQNGILK